MKKLLGIVVLGLVFCNTSFADDLRGKELFCKSEFKYDTPHGFVFKTKSVVIIYGYDEEWHRIKAKYKAMQQKIEIYGKHKGNDIEGSIDRKTLKSDLIASNNGVGVHQCDLTRGVVSKMKWLYKKHIENLKKENKL